MRAAVTRKLLILGAVGLVLAVAGCGGGGSSSTVHARQARGGRHPSRRRARVPAGPARLAYRPLFSLPAPLRDPASGLLGGGRFALVGGLDGGDVSTSEADVLDRHGLLVSHQLPAAQHDAQAAVLGGQVYVFGGGSATELDHILRFDPSTGTVSTVGQLPQAQSDVAVTELGGTAYVVGGYNGTDWENTILAWRPGSAVRVAGRLPVGLRYSAVVAVAGRILVLGGSTPEAASDAVYSFDPATGAVRRIGRLPQATTHASAAALGGYAYLIGGRGDELTSQTDRVWSVDPRTGAVRPAGRLPQPLSDTGAVAVGGAIVVAGGQGTSQVSSAVGELVPVR